MREDITFFAAGLKRGLRDRCLLTHLRNHRRQAAPFLMQFWDSPLRGAAVSSSTAEIPNWKLRGKKINEGEVISSARLSTSGNVFQLKTPDTHNHHSWPASFRARLEARAGRTKALYFKELPAPWKERPQIDLGKIREWGLSRCSEPFFFINISVHFPLSSVSLQAINTLFLSPTKSGLGAYPASPPSR